MTVDLLTATFFWPDGTLSRVPDGTSPHLGQHAADEALPCDPLAADDEASFWTLLLRTVGWRFSSKVAVPS